MQEKGKKREKGEQEKKFFWPLIIGGRSSAVKVNGNELASWLVGWLEGLNMQSDE